MIDDGAVRLLYARIAIPTQSSRTTQRTEVRTRVRAVPEDRGKSAEQRTAGNTCSFFTSAKSMWIRKSSIF